MCKTVTYKREFNAIYFILQYRTCIRRGKTKKKLHNSFWRIMTIYTRIYIFVVAVVRYPLSPPPSCYPSFISLFPSLDMYPLRTGTIQFDVFKKARRGQNYCAETKLSRGF